MQLFDKDDIKIFILYLLNNLDRPMEYSDINDVVVQDGVVSSIDFAECFGELLDAGNVDEIYDAGTAYYVITDKGKHIATSLQSDLRSEIKTRGLKNALRFLKYKDQGCKVETSFESRKDGRYDLICSIKDEYHLSLEIKIVAEDANQLAKMRKIFNDRPEIVYRGVVALLTGDIDYLLD